MPHGLQPGGGEEVESNRYAFTARQSGGAAACELHAPRACMSAGRVSSYLMAPGALCRAAGTSAAIP